MIMNYIRSTCPAEKCELVTLIIQLAMMEVKYGSPPIGSHSGGHRPGFTTISFFIFFACPYVLADPGINYEVLPQRELNGKTLNAIKISYHAGVGDAPDDYYIAHFDATTNEMYLLLYTVTYFNQATNENYNALIYDDWTEVGSLKVPQSMKGYRWAADTLGDQRYVRPFERIEISERSLDPSIFEIPDGAIIDTLITEK